MAPKGNQMSLVLVVVVMLWGGARAQSGCTSALLGLSPCLTFVTGNSSTPSSSCCSTLSNIVQSQPQCLCSLVNGGAANLGIPINQTLALTLPGASVANAPTSSASTPVSPPTSSPADNSEDAPPTPTTPSVPSIPSGTPSKNVPTTGSTSGGSMLNFSFKFAVAILLILMLSFQRDLNVS
ncbi:Non-specific lipid-transfer protein-like protein family [Heracleum sosnowskyi]|uniref:Non-specific lipid-transfer protein-like protein family n=1 Tax=Heracleum sosnowskyi TaxID=360622 RepID=A0AAD8GQQ6_9APIA|nr:Non-specific lipid-transfer protein-like protein family [Heracleum sosnowskyi]